MKTIEAIRTLAQHAAFLPNEKELTLPLVTMEGDHVILRRLVYVVRVTPDAAFMTEPQYLLAMDMTSGKFLAARSMTEKDHPAKLPPAPWKHTPFDFQTPEQMLAEYDRIYELYDKLIPGFIQKPRQARPEYAAAAKEYVKLFERHAEPPLMAYYEMYGGEFLRWVRETAMRGN